MERFRDLPEATLSGLDARTLVMIGDRDVMSVEHAAAGRVRLDIEQVPLADVTDAWRRQAEGAGTKLVVVP